MVLELATGRELSDEQVFFAVLRQEVNLLTEELAEYDRYRSYFDGEQPLVFGTDRFRAKFGLQFAAFKDNWTSVVVDAVQERLEIEGIEIPGNETLSKRIWEILRANDWDEQQGELHEGALVEGKAFAIVWPDEKLGARVDWQPAQIVRVRYADDDWRQPVFAIKRWITPGGQGRVTVYTPQFVYKFHAINETAKGGKVGVRATVPDSAPSVSWARREVPGEPWPLPNPFNEIPIVEYTNKNGSEIKHVIPQQDAVNYLLINGFLATEFAAFNQRGFFGGVKAPTEGWDNSPGTIWEIPPTMDADGKPIPQSAFTFPPAELGGFIQMVEMMLQHMALTSKTPVRLFHKSDRGGRGDAPSGDSLLVEDEPLIDKIENRQKRFGNGHYRLVRLIAKAINEESELPPGEVRWKDPRAKYRSSIVKEGALMVKDMGMPIEFVVEHLMGFSPEQIDRFKELLEEMKAEREQLAQQQLQQQAQQSFPSTPNESPAE